MTASWARVRAELVELKAQYFFCVDNKLWEQLRALFTDDATFRGVGFRVDGPDDFVARTAGVFTGVHSQHYGFQPVFAAGEDGSARARWSMQDFLTWDPQQTSLPGITSPGAHSLHGFGYYEDSYRLEDGRWRIASTRLIRTRLDVTSEGPMPVTFPVAEAIDPLWAQG